MERLMKKYAKILLETCLKVEKNQPLFISFNVERVDFARIVAEKAFELGIKDIFFDMVDPYLKHEALLNLDVSELKDLTFWNKEMWNIYAKKNAAFLMLASENPGLMRDVDPEKLKEMTKYSYETRKEFDDMRDKSALAWCIAAVPTESWGKKLFPNSPSPTKELWNKIFEICKITEEDSESIWNNKIAKLTERGKKLTNYQFDKLIYNGSNGTNFSIKLPKKHIWKSALEHLINGKDILVNFPTEEVFISPDCFSGEGIVYSSKPLSYNDVIINNFNISFKDGKVIDFSAEEGEEVLKNMINICENSNMIGEIALVPYDSPISNSKMTFLETLYDENASCHIALGDSFPECIEKGETLDKDLLFNEYHLNKCDSHVDFMVGTKDLNIIGITKNGEEIPIFINGDFSKEFE